MRYRQFDPKNPEAGSLPCRYRTHGAVFRVAEVDFPENAQPAGMDSTL